MTTTELIIITAAVLIVSSGFVALGYLIGYSVARRDAATMQRRVAEREKDRAARMAARFH